ncbi:MAG TPA: hypothetical protein VMV79_07810 [Alphaproteobacteria bacterium]|nr:hypothetical protein [Alphaproteobacteria bacterium]
MNAPRPHVPWLALVALALTIAFGSGPLARILQTSAAQRLPALETQRAQAAKNLRQLQSDAALARKLSGQIDAAGAARMLAPVDRLQAAAQLERAAAASGLRHFTYTIGAEHPVTVTDSGLRQKLARCSIRLAADAPLDTDASAFIVRIQKILPGRVRVRAFSLTRIGGANTPLGAVNLRFTATLAWLSNGARTVLAGTP